MTYKNEISSELLSSSLNLLSNDRYFTLLSITFYFLPYYVKMENNI